MVGWKTKGLVGWRIKNKWGGELTDWWGGELKDWWGGELKDWWGGELVGSKGLGLWISLVTKLIPAIKSRASDPFVLINN